MRQRDGGADDERRAERAAAHTVALGVGRGRPRRRALALQRVCIVVVVVLLFAVVREKDVLWAFHVSLLLCTDPKSLTSRRYGVLWRVELGHARIDVIAVRCVDHLVLFVVICQPTRSVDDTRKWTHATLRHGGEAVAGAAVLARHQSHAPGWRDDDASRILFAFEIADHRLSYGQQTESEMAHEICGALQAERQRPHPPAAKRGAHLEQTYAALCTSRIRFDVVLC
jgi:hypothetical protein